MAYQSKEANKVIPHSPSTDRYCVKMRIFAYITVNRKVEISVLEPQRPGAQINVIVFGNIQGVGWNTEQQDTAEVASVLWTGGHGLGGTAKGLVQPQVHDGAPNRQRKWRFCARNSERLTRRCADAISYVN